MIDVIIPTVAGREASLARTIESFEAHTADLNVVTVTDSETCGKGWKEGLARSEAPYIALLSDDLVCTDDRWAEVCIEAADEGFIVCPRIWTPDGRIESQGGDMDAYQHLISLPQKDRSTVDYATVPFCSREAIEAIGVPDTHYACDVWVSYRGRQLGYESILRHGFELVHHHEQAGRGAGMSQAERDAMDCETVFRELEKCAA